MTEDSKSFYDEWAEPLIFGGLALACLLIYGQTIGFDFINLDDHAYVYLNPVITSGINGESIKWAFTAVHSSNWHPLTWLSHALDVQMFGLNAGAHHAVNVILHLANSCLAFVVFRSLTGSTWKSAIVAFLFAVHPAHVESVAWISERKDVLSTLFWLLAMLTYVWYSRSPGAEGNVARRMASPFLILTFVLLAIGLLAKPMLVTLPFVLLLLDRWPLGRMRKRSDLLPLLIEKLPLFLLSAASAFVTYSAQQASGSVLDLARYPLGGRIMNSITAYAKYIGMLFYPAELGVWYPFRASIDTFELIVSVAVLTSVTALAVRQWNRRPYLAVGWFWFLGTLVPVIGLVQVGAQSMADRYTYIPYFGLFVMLVWGVAELVERFKVNRRLAAAFTVFIIAFAGLVAFGQTSYWKNNETLYKRTIAVTEDNFFLMNLLCKHYIDRTSAANAERRCTELLGNTTNYPEAHNTIGLLRVELGRYDDAIASYRKALQIKPDTALFYSNIAVAFARKGDAEQAEQNLLKAIELVDASLSRDALVYSTNAVGEAFAAKNDKIKARNYFQNAIKYDPDFKPAQDNLRKLQETENEDTK